VCQRSSTSYADDSCMISPVWSWHLVALSGVSGSQTRAEGCCRRAEGLLPFLALFR